MADDVEVKFGANTNGLDAGSKKAVADIDAVKLAADGMSKAFRGMAELVIAAFATDKLMQFVNGMAELGNVTSDTAAMLGVSTERVGQLAYIANASGNSLESMAAGMERLAVNAVKAASGSKTETDAFSRLGVSVRDAGGNIKSTDQLIREAADSFAAHADGSEKAALAMQLFGRAGIQLIPILNGGSREFAELEQRAARTGSVLSSTTVQGMVQVQQNLVEMNAAFRGLGVAIFSSFQPAINGIVVTVTQLIERLTGWINQSYMTGGAMRALALVMDTVVAAILATVAAFELLFDVASAIIDSLTHSLSALAKSIAYALSGNFAAAAAESQAGAAAIVKTWSDTGTDMAKILGDMTTNIKEMWAATLNPPTEVTVPYGGPGGGGGGKPAFGAPADQGALDKLNKKLQELKGTLSEVQGMFQGMISGIVGGFDRAISGMINGTMSWKEAMFTVIDSLWSTLVKFAEDWLSKWLANEAMMLVAHQTSNAEKLASDVATENMAGTNMIFNAIKAIFASSKQTAAGVTANLSPTLGPLAIPAGLAAGATVAGMASFDIGAWRLDRDQVAQVHKDEMIVPARGGQADKVRDMLSGHGEGATSPVFNFNGPVLDKEGLARMVVGVLNKNPSMRGAW